MPYFEQTEDGIFVIYLVDNDRRWGQYKADGAIAKWPDLDALGQEYQRSHATLRRIGNRFVVIPIGKDGMIQIEVQQEVE